MRKPIKSIDPKRVTNMGTNEVPKLYKAPTVLATFLQVGGRCYRWDGGTFRNGNVWLPEEGQPLENDYGFDYPVPPGECDCHDVTIVFLDPPEQPKPDYILYVSRGRLLYRHMNVVLQRMKRFVRKRQQRGDVAYLQHDFNRALILYNEGSQVSHDLVDFLAELWASIQASDLWWVEVIQGLVKASLDSGEKLEPALNALAVRGIMPPPNWTPPA